jgi:hypothetical protein
VRVDHLSAAQIRAYVIGIVVKLTDENIDFGGFKAGDGNIEIEFNR